MRTLDNSMDDMDALNRSWDANESIDIDVAQSPPKRTSTLNQITQNARTLSQFDPLIPSDWMMSFESPSVRQTLTSTKQRQPSTPLSTSQPQPSLLIETLNDPSTPKQTLKYTQKDLENLTIHLQAKHDSQFELCQLEIQDLITSRDASHVATKEMRGTLVDWERVMEGMINEGRLAKEGWGVEKEGLRRMMEKKDAEVEGIVREGDVVYRKYKQTRLDLEDLKEVRDEDEQGKKDLLEWKSNYETLKNHATAKLEGANVEIKKVRDTYEKEIQVLKGKLMRSEAQNNSYEKQCENKTKENEELTRICDDLLAQIEMS